MISVWMLYASAVALLLALGALLLERLLLAAGRPVRWPWLAAVAGSVVLPFLAVWLPGAHAPASSAVGIGLGEPVMVASATAGPAGAGEIPAARGWIEWALAVAWLAGSCALLAAVALGVWLLERQRAGWRHRVVDGRAVLISPRTGPAVAGILWPEIVFPRWVLDRDERTQRLLLAHEREHLRAGDSHLLVAAIAALVLFPWNLPLWWQVRRLRLAIEVDCDARVLRWLPDARSYGLLLLEVGRRVSRLPLSAAAFAESRSSLERRIRILARPPGRPRRRTLLATGTAALLTPAAIYALPVPDAPDLEQLLDAARADVPHHAALPSDTPPPSRADGLDREPRFTPYEIRPELRNRAELAQAIERHYPPLLRDAGIGGTAVVWVFIDEEGQVGNVRLFRGSGHEQLDEAAVAAMRVAKFTLALNRDRKVPVWIQLPVTFRAAREAAAGERTVPVPIWTAPRAPDAPDWSRAPQPAEAPGAPAAEPAPAPERPVDPLPTEVHVIPPPPAPQPSVGERPTFTPYEEKPSLQNRAEFGQAVERLYPQSLRAAGVGGTAVFWVFIDEQGDVANVRLTHGSGHPELDQAAAAALRAAKFSPALNRDQPVPVWIQLPVTFQSR